MASPTPPPYQHYPSTKPHHHPSHNPHLHRAPRKIPSLPPTPSPSTSSTTTTSTTTSSSSSSASRSASPELGPDFRGSRSTRVVSKRNLTRPRYSSTTSGRVPSPSALNCLARLSHVGPDEKSTTDLLHSFDLLLSGTDDYGFLIREIGEQRISSGDLHLKALQCFHFAITRMRGPTERGKLLTSLITALGKLGRPDLARQAFDSAISDGYASTVYAYSALIAAYARNGLSSLALSAFDSMKSAGMRPNSVTYNTLIDACVKGGEDLHTTTIGIFRQMLRNGVRPDRITFNSLLAGCSRAGHWEHARNMFDEMLLHGIHRDVFTYNTFIDAVCKCGNMDMAADIVSEMEAHHINPNIVTYSTLMDGYSKLDRYDDALSVYEKLKSFSIPMDRVCFNTLLSIYVKMGRYDDVVRTSEDMEKLGVDRDVVTYNALIAGYGKQGRFEVVSYLIQSMRAEDIVMNVLTYSTLIDVYSKGGLYQKAMEIYMEFRETGLRADVVFYTTLIDTLSRNGRVESAVWLLNEMIRVGIRPNVVTYNSIINAFGRTGGSGDDEGRRERGQLVKGQRRNSQEFFCILGLFQRMHSLGIRPNVVTFSSILNACSHCDSFEDASLLLEQLRSLDGRVYGVAHGLLMGSKEVWVQARLLFDELKRMDASTAAAFYNALTDMLWHFGQRRGAQLVVMEGRRRNAWDTTWTDSCLDLHLMSPGAAQAMVHAWLLNMRSVAYEGRELPQLVSILTGWGKHSKVSGSSALRRCIERLLVSLGTPFRVERFNMGRFISHGVDLAAWLSEVCDVNILVLYDARVQTENGGCRQLPDLQALKL